MADQRCLRRCHGGRGLRFRSDGWPTLFRSRLLANVQGRRAALLRAGSRGIQTPAPLGVQACTARGRSGHRSGDAAEVAAGAGTMLWASTAAWQAGGAGLGNTAARARTATSGARTYPAQKVVGAMNKAKTAASTTGQLMTLVK